MTKTREELEQLKQEYETLNNKLKELTEDELLQVAGGSGRARTMYISVSLPSNLETSSNLDVYENGIRNELESRVLESYQKTVTLKIKGITGSVNVEVKINDVSYKKYVVDFDHLSIKELEI